ncbi:MAG: hypothetical protein M1420_05100 [Actinobacteria bacterium]|jgi:hypothetical protein|nr:hypothetical protein [Actinomycetota bacterium]
MDTLEIIRELEHDDALRAALRAVILGDELLSLPDQMRLLTAEVQKLTEAQERTERAQLRTDETVRGLVETVKGLTEAQERTDARVDKLVEAVDRLTEAQERTDARVDKLVEAVDRLTEAQERTDARVDKLDSRLGRLEGGHFESKWEKDGTSYLGSRGFRRGSVVDKNTLANLLDDAVDAGALDSDIRNDILLVDAVHSAIDKKSSTTVYIATEVSSRIHVEDVERAIRRSASLETATGVRSKACVAGASIDDIARSIAEKNNVIIVLPSEWDIPQVA